MKTLILYMKSGHKITVPDVVEWSGRVNGNDILSLTIIWNKNRKGGLALQTLDLSQIEAIVEK